MGVTMAATASVPLARAESALAEALLAFRRELHRFIRRLYVPPSSLSLDQLRLLGELHRRGPLRVGELADLEQVSLPTMTQGIDRLVSHGWVARTTGRQDRRSVDVAITDGGRTAYQTAHAEVIRRMVERLDRLSDQDREAIARALPALEQLVRE